MLTVEHVHRDIGLVGVRRNTRVVSRVRRLGVADEQTTQSLGQLFGVYRDAALQVVVDDPARVVPEHVVGGHGALQDLAAQVKGAPAVEVERGATGNAGFAS